VSDKTGNPWKTAAMILAAVLAVVLVCFALVVAGVMDLGLSLM
jgi:hypothetical protein